MAEDNWGDGAIAREQAEAFAQRVPSLTTLERIAVARDLAAFPPECRVRGVFFEGLSRVVAKSGGTTMGDLLAAAGVPPRKVAFSLYPHRDFYKVYFLAARALYPRSSLGTALSQVSRTFYPIFRESMIGRTMSAFIGNDPHTLLARLADAYNLSVPWNEHRLTSAGAREIVWRCKVEPTSHYREVFSGIVSGATASHGAGEVRIEVESTRIDAGAGHHTFRVQW